VEGVPGTSEITASQVVIFPSLLTSLVPVVVRQGRTDVFWYLEDVTGEYCRCTLGNDYERATRRPGIYSDGYSVVFWELPG
jgi:hypothetical protein